MAGSLRERMHADLTAAIRARDAVRVSTLRTVLGAVANAEAVPTGASVVPAAFGSTEVPRRDVGEEELRDIVGRERDDLCTTADELRRHGRHDASAHLVAKAAILDAYLTP